VQPLHQLALLAMMMWRLLMTVLFHHPLYLPGWLAHLGAQRWHLEAGGLY
jgi:hypothetical protein